MLSKMSTLFVNHQIKRFEVIDAVGIGAITHYRVVNHLTNEYVTKQIRKDEAQQIAADLNDLFDVEMQKLDEMELHEIGPTRQHFRMVANTVRQIEDPKTRQALANHHAEIFSKINKDFSHEKFHEACGTKCPGKTVAPAHDNVGATEGYQLASTPITENIHDTSNIARYAAFMNSNADKNRMDGGAFQSTSVARTAMNDFRQTAMLQSRATKKFAGNTETTEHNAIRSRQNKGVERPSQSVELLVNDGSSDKDFLASINKAGLLKG